MALLLLLSIFFNVLRNSTDKRETRTLMREKDAITYVIACAI